MNSYEVIILLIAIAAIAIQFRLLWRSRSYIRLLREWIPSTTKLSVRRVFIPKDSIKTIDIEEILSRLREFSKSPEERITEKQFLQHTTADVTVNEMPASVPEETHEVKLIQANTPLRTESEAIIRSINVFLLRNEGTTGDFRTLQDMVNRSTDQLEQETQRSNTLPLYMGIVGCIVCLAIWIWPLSLSSSLTLSLTAFKIAALPLVTGIILYVMTIGFLMRDAGIVLEKRRIAFLNFLQSEMQTQLSHNLTSAVFSMEKYLARFNRAFQEQTDKYTDTLNGIRDTFDQQARLIHELRHTDVVKLSELNAHVLKELRISTESFEKFNQYLHQMNAFVAGMDRLNSNIERQFTQTTFMEKMGKTIADQTETNRKILELLQADLHQIDARKQFMADAVINVDETLQKSLDELRQHTEEKLASVRRLRIEDEDWLGIDRLTASIEALRKGLDSPRRKPNTEKKDA